MRHFFYQICCINGSETMIWIEKERSRIKDVQVDNLRGLLSIRRMDRVLNAWIKGFCRVANRSMK